MPMQPISSLSDGIGRGLMALCALAAAYAAITGLIAAPAPEIAWVFMWRTLGFAMFSALFALLALRPRLSPGLWELAFFHKAALGVAAIFLAGAPEAAEAGAFDAVLAAIIAIAYALTKGWQGWRR